VVAGALAATGCGGDSGGDSGDAASTTAPATTAPATSAPAATTAPASTAAAPVAAGTVAAGKVVFSNTCAGCHAGLGTRAGFGPQLAAQGLTAAVITTTVENGKGQMPAGLASGQDLADVVAYVESLQ
jgi:mono/diheme cytochrome c family protein